MTVAEHHHFEGARAQRLTSGNPSGTTTQTGARGSRVRLEVG